MTHFVVDASVAVEYLLRTPLGLTVADMIEGASLTAPWRRWLGSTTGMSALMRPSTSLLPAPAVSLS